MRGSRRFAVVPIIAFTSLDESEVFRRGKEVQIDADCRKGNPLIHTLLTFIEHLAPVAFSAAELGRNATFSNSRH